MAAGGIAVAATLALGVAGASAATPAQLAPNPGYGYSGPLVGATGGVGSANDVSPSVPAVEDYGQSGSPSDGPQTANVPYLAWAGEDVRLVACDDKISNGSNAQPPYDLETADWSNENWTGDQFYSPTFDGNQTNDYELSSGSDSFFPPTDTDTVSGNENAGKGCTDVDVKDLHAGLAQIKLNVYF
jgi:hypothetical protein